MSTAEESRQRVLVVDDEADIRELIEITLGRMGLDTIAAADLSQARDALVDQPVDLCLTDMRLPDGNGLDLIHHIEAQYPALPVAVITAYGNTEAAVDSLKAGAFDFVSKPVDVHKLRRLVDQALKIGQPVTAAPANRRNGESPRLLGDTPAMQRLRQTIAKLARSQAPVYITGESGTGKELVARTIHAQGPRAAMPFVPVNCGAIPTELMESEFFGHVKGAFTGAARDKDGLFVAAEGGTLFLDEIADLPRPMQVKLLRAIQERAVRPVGAETEIPVDVRIISATHRDLATLVTKGDFREDLYFRLNVIEVHVPPLRERAADIPELADCILAGLASHLGLDPTPSLAASARDALQAHDFPGNVRELENILERAVTLCDDADIGVEYLRLQSPLARPDENTAPPTAETRPAGVEPLENRLEHIERQSIIQALEATRYNKTRAAEKLGISFRALRYRLKKLGID
ncbi:sigma-54 dependent transcriptional regulator [Salinisphaera sp. P385]|uniref:Sigma-54 dependent transcriptional regulator n=1 Tax=Spectribacter acetivorans TaxID=3075603 RepID=A0ABU3BBE6_9GAMM|nr:sigma-54 dependent transcriptional regulator [Salinisphaera sp. P385]MDT0619791.1 sigma-54 dependent transcriptional regulator [Salinisphaera sp. P385]